MPREDVRQLFAKNPAFLDMNLPHKNRTALPFLQARPLPSASCFLLGSCSLSLVPRVFARGGLCVS